MCFLIHKFLLTTWRSGCYGRQVVYTAQCLFLLFFFFFSSSEFNIDLNTHFNDLRNLFWSLKTGRHNCLKSLLQMV